MRSITKEETMTVFYDLYVREVAGDWQFIKRTALRDLVVGDAERAVDRGFFAKIREYEKELYSPGMISESMLCAAEEELIPFAELELQIAKILETRTDREAFRKDLEILNDEPVDVSIGQITALASALGYETHILLRERGEHVQLIDKPFPKHDCDEGEAK
jgi:hypothetical protein